MQATESFLEIAEGWKDAVATTADSESPVTPVGDATSEAWRNVIDRQLKEWALHSGDFQDEGIPAPSGRTLQLAFNVVNKMLAMKAMHPTRVVPDTGGGIVFELRRGRQFESVHVLPDGSIDYCCFLDSRLMRREPWIL